MALFESWASLGHTALAALAGYVMLIAVLRISGKRTLAKLNAFDLVVTVALGSTLASVITSDRLPLANGLLALGLLVLLQYSVAWMNLRSSWVRRLVKSDPTLLVSRGVMLHDALRQSRVAADEILAALRSAGLQRLEDAAAVVLETDGSLSVLTERSAADGASTLRDVR